MYFGLESHPEDKLVRAIEDLESQIGRKDVGDEPLTDRIFALEALAEKCRSRLVAISKALGAGPQENSRELIDMVNQFEEDIGLQHDERTSVLERIDSLEAEVY